MGLTFYKFWDPFRQRLLDGVWAEVNERSSDSNRGKIKILHKNISRDYNVGHPNLCKSLCTKHEDKYR